VIVLLIVIAVIVVVYLLTRDGGDAESILLPLMVPGLMKPAAVKELFVTPRSNGLGRTRR
jgi:hypothetical protein